MDILDCEEGSSSFEQSPLSDSSQQPTCCESWEDFQSLSPFGADWDMEQEFFKSGFIDLDCKSQGPTLAELNNQRSTSPLINPEMERLHRIATRTEAEPTSSTRTGSHLLLKYNVDERELNTENQRYVTSKNGGKVFSGDMSGKRSLGEEKKGLKSSCELESRTPLVISSTSTVQKDDTIELRKDPDIMKRIALMEPKSIGQTIVDNSRNIQQNQSDILTGVPCSELSRSARNLPVEEELPVIKEEESADEDMDSDEDFDEPRCVNDDGETPVKQRKGRRGDVEDLSPNPRRLLEIGRELNRLTKIITELKPIHSLPMSARNKSKKEKNKLASR